MGVPARECSRAGFPSQTYSLRSYSTSIPNAAASPHDCATKRALLFVFMVEERWSLPQNRHFSICFLTINRYMTRTHARA